MYNTLMRDVLLRKMLISKDKEDIESYFDHPKYLLISTIDACNAKCVMCPTHLRPPKRMSDQLFEKIVHECKELKPRNIAPYMQGEPFLDAKIFKRIELLDKTVPDIPLIIVTNAVLLNEEKIKRLFEYNVGFINISINAASKKTHKDVMGLEYGKLLENMNLILKYCKNTHIQVSFIKLPLNEHEAEKFKEIWKYSVDSIKIASAGNWAGTLAFQADDNNKNQEQIEDMMRQPTQCLDQITSMFIISTGAVVHCCEDTGGSFPIGDANKETLFNLWHSKTNEFLRCTHLEGAHRRDIPICQNCDLI